MPPDDRIEMIINILSGLTTKVDGIIAHQVTRHEFDSLNSRMDMMLLKSEFEQFKSSDDRYREGQMSAVKVSNDDLDCRLQALEKHAGKLPPWLVNLLIAAVAAAIGGAVGGYFESGAAIIKTHVGG